MSETRSRGGEAARTLLGSPPAIDGGSYVTAVDVAATGTMSSTSGEARIVGVDNPLHDLEVADQSQDGSVSATLSGGGNLIHFRIHPRAYHACREETLESQLGALLRDLWNDYRRRYFQALSDAIGTTVRENEYQGGVQERKFRQEWRALLVEGVSPDHSIRIRSAGLQQWQVRIQQGTIRRASETEFVASLNAAFNALMIDYRNKIADLRDEIFHLSLPKTHRSPQRR